MKRRILFATLAVAGFALVAYLVADKSRADARPVNTQSPSDATRCLVASFNPQVFCLHGSADSLLHDLDELGEHHYSSRRVYAIVLECDERIDVFLVTNEPESTVTVQHFASNRPDAPNLLGRLQEQLFLNKGISCAGDLAEAVLTETLPLVKKGVFHTPVSPRLILRHPLRDRGQAYLRLSLLCLC